MRVDFVNLVWYNLYMYNHKEISNRLATAIDCALKKVDDDILRLLKEAYANEDNPRAKWALAQIIENDEIALAHNCYPCQDTGVAMLFVTVGQNATFDGSLENALTEGVRLGYADARKSIAHPLTRINTGDNTPAVIYYDVVDGDGLKVDFLAKGAGSENTSCVKMLTPSKGADGIVSAVCDIVKQAGANPCPPLLLGVGVGGTMDKACLLSKKALLRKCGQYSADTEVAKLEKRILDEINALGIGAQGLGGKHTALACAVEIAPTHIGMLPVAVTIQCHSARHTKVRF